MPTFDTERWYIEAGESLVAGFDEVGMAAFAGPVVVAGVVLEPEFQEWMDELDDSKKLPRRVREELADVIVRKARAYATAEVWPEEIDAIGVHKARNAAMVEAHGLLLVRLQVNRLASIVDGRLLHGLLPPPAMYMDHADELSVSVAAASIVAKVLRDTIMRTLAQSNPGYGWSHNVGYGTRKHLAAIERLGPTAYHRFSFRPLSKYSRSGYSITDGTGGTS